MGINSQKRDIFLLRISHCQNEKGSSNYTSLHEVSIVFRLRKTNSLNSCNSMTKKG